MFTPNPIAHEAVLIRHAQPGDEAELIRWAQLDSASPISGSAVVAEHDGTIVAARSLENEHEIADPFVPTAGLLALLRVHAESQPAVPRRVLGRRLGRSAEAAC